MRLTRWLNLVIYAVLLAANALAGSVGLNGNDVGSVSDGIPSVFTPAGYVFSIWGLIYLGLGAFVIYGILPSQRQNPMIDRAGIWFALGSIFNMLWLVVWLYEAFLLSQVFMLLLLASLIILCLRLGAGFRQLRRSDLWCVAIPFSVYLGWISVATIANTSILLVVNNITELGVSGEFWTITMMLAAYMIAAAMVFLRHDWMFGFVIIWAVIGIAVNNPNSIALSIAAGIVSLGLMIVFYLDRENSPFIVPRATTG